MRNSGGRVPTFTSFDAGALTSGKSDTALVRFADIDADGDVDAILGMGALSSANVYEVLDRVMLNDGTGSYTETFADGVAVLTSAIRDTEPPYPTRDKNMCVSVPELTYLRSHAPA